MPPEQSVYDGPLQWTTDDLNPPYVRPPSPVPTPTPVPAHEPNWVEAVEAGLDDGDFVNAEDM